MGLDIGRARTGVSLSSPGQGLATPLVVLPTEPLLTLGRRLAADFRKVGTAPAELAGLVAGLPLEKTGREGPAAVWTRQAAEICRSDLGKALGRPDLALEFVDERFSSRAQEQLGKELGFSRRQRSQHSDAWAATAILQSWLDRLS